MDTNQPCTNRSGTACVRHSSAARCIQLARPPVLLDKHYMANDSPRSSMCRKAGLNMGAAVAHMQLVQLIEGVSYHREPGLRFQAALQAYKHKAPKHVCRPNANSHGPWDGVCIVNMCL